MVGEVWSQIVAYGPNFADPNNYNSMLYVGNPGDSGIVEMQDLLFTSVGNLPGLVLMQWNIVGSPQAGAALWGESLPSFQSIVAVFASSCVAFS